MDRKKVEQVLIEKGLRVEDVFEVLPDRYLLAMAQIHCPASITQQRIRFNATRGMVGHARFICRRAKEKK